MPSPASRQERPSLGPTLEPSWCIARAEQERDLREDLGIGRGRRQDRHFAEIALRRKPGAWIDEVMTALPRPLGRAARRRAEILQQERLLAEADRPALAAFAATAGVEIAAEIHEHVLAELRCDAIGQPTLGEAPEV